jgi:hypothetical protein
MPFLPILHQATAAGDAAAVTYAASVALAALVSLLPRSSQRRHDARETLKILLRRKS